MAPINSYRDLVVWQEAMNVAEATYRLTRNFPKEELYGLTAQARRSASSVPANIAEGYGRESKGAYVHFLRTAQGSLKELETHCTIAQRVGIADDGIVAGLLEQSESIGKLLRLLIRRLVEAS